MNVAQSTHTAPPQPQVPAKRARRNKKVRYSPRLRTRLIAILVSMLGVACIIIGSSSYVAIHNSLLGQVIANLNGTSLRAGGGPEGGESSGNLACPTSDNNATGKNPLLIPGQVPGTLGMCFDRDGQTTFAGILDSKAHTQGISDSDKNLLSAIRLGAQDGVPVEVELESGGHYLVQVSKGKPGSGNLLVGVPMGDMHQTLAATITVMVIGSVAVMVLAGMLGSYIIRRTMRPLERVSAVATDVANLNLGEHTISQQVKVMPKDADPRTEVGAVGYALNQLLDNVSSALEVRERTEQQIRAFIADASHELRTPLAAIKGYSDMMRWTEAMSENGQSSLARIDSQTVRMSRLVEDLLLLARLDEGREPQFELIDLTELLIECLSDMQAAARTHVWRLDVPDEPVEMIADRSQLQQVILNLLSNARKHTDDGTTVIAGLRVSADRSHALMTVVDNGPGIDPQFVDKIFDRFARADKARSGSDGTTGLGLSIVQAIVRVHGGTISVKSRPGRTEFMVRLPLASAAPAQARLSVQKGAVGH